MDYSGEAPCPSALRSFVFLYMMGFLGDIEVMVSRNIDIPKDRIEEFCRRWKIREFSLFGSLTLDGYWRDLVGSSRRAP